jgi:glycerophosphoryl diester phosphodiesterase
MPEKNLHPDVHGHRGCRGLLPENSMPAFLRATELGCDYLELDVVLSGDGQVVVSHEPWMSGRICLAPAGEDIPRKREQELNLHRMSVAEIRRYDCGSLEHPDFPHQELMPVHKPTLREVVEAVDEHTLMNGMASASFNIEIKSRPEWYGIFQSQPAPYVAAVIATIDSLGIAERCLLQSFDPAILEAIREQRPGIPLAFLVEESRGVAADLSLLSFVPEVYSPWFPLVDRRVLRQVRELGMDLVVWTVNEPQDIRRMLDLGVDGIISDYPDRVMRALEERD